MIKKEKYPSKKYMNIFCISQCSNEHNTTNEQKEQEDKNRLKIQWYLFLWIQMTSNVDWLNNYSIILLSVIYTQKHKFN